MGAQIAKMGPHEVDRFLFWGALIGLILVPFLVERLLALLKLRRPNFEGRWIPTGYGLLILLWSSPLLAAKCYLQPDSGRLLAAYLVVIVGMGAFGLIDDLWGDRSVSGLRGHLRKFLLDGEITTGFLKAIGGCLLALLVPRVILTKPWPDTLLDGATIALCANAVNLLDVRPGRACAFFFLGALALLLAHGSRWNEPPFLPLLYVIIPALLVYERDARGQAMLGDVGSNLLGGVLGLAIALAQPPRFIQYGLLLALILLHVLAERYSLSTLIERNALLRWLDRRTGKR
jgi:UDP-N-acetylmuramyl pentapeptide phosphotransferase/UDP-N-acetylglucosamine-1-phosphate transferase